MAVLEVVEKTSRSRTATLLSLTGGDVFDLNGQLYLRTGSRMVDGDIQCVTLYGGYNTFSFPPLTPVTPAEKATLNLVRG